MIYSFRIKIVAMRLRTSPASPLITLSCTLNNRILAEKSIQMQDGLLVQNTTINFQLDAASLIDSKSIVLRFSEKEIASNEIGTASISMCDFQSVKMRKIRISTQDPKEEAFIETFLLMLQSRQQTAPIAITPPTVRTGPFAKGLIQPSKIRIQIENSSAISCIEPQSPLSLSICSPTLRKHESQEAETQTYNIESLLTLNSILEEANAALEKEKEDLMRRLCKLEATVDNQETRRHIDNQYKLRIEEMHDEIEILKESLKEKERKLNKAEAKLEQKMDEISSYYQEISQKDVLLERITQQSLHYQHQLSILQERQVLSVKDLNIDQMMLEITKYSQTAKRYKRSMGKETAAPMKLTSLPTSTEDRSSVKDFLKISQRSQSRRVDSKKSSKRCISGGQETLDSMTESKVFF